MNIEDELEEDDVPDGGRPALVPVEGGRPPPEVFVVVVPEAGGREPVAVFEDDVEDFDVDAPDVEVFGRPPSGFFEYEPFEVELEVEDLEDALELEGREGLPVEVFGRPPVPTLDELDVCEADLLCTVTSRPTESL